MFVLWYKMNYLYYDFMKYLVHPWLMFKPQKKRWNIQKKAERRWENVPPSLLLAVTMTMHNGWMWANRSRVFAVTMDTSTNERAEQGERPERAIMWGLSNYYTWQVITLGNNNYQQPSVCDISIEHNPARSNSQSVTQTEKHLFIMCLIMWRWMEITKIRRENRFFLQVWFIK